MECHCTTGRPHMDGAPRLERKPSLRPALTLPLPLSPPLTPPPVSSQHLPRTASMASSCTTATTHEHDVAADEIDRTVASVLTSPTNAKGHITIAPQKAPHERDYMDGYMVVHAKKPKKKLFTLHRSSYFVVADATRPFLEIYNNESRSELVYVLSLAGAQMGFETADGSTVMAKCFCLDVKAWKKRDVVHFRPQGFLFYQEDQALMLVWVKVIHLAIKKAAQGDSSRTFRCSDASTVSTESRFVDDASDVSDRDRERRTSFQPTHEDSDRSCHDDPPTAAAAALFDTPHEGRTHGRRRAAIDSINCSSLKSPLSGGSRPLQFPRFNSVLATMKSPPAMHHTPPGSCRASPTSTTSTTTEKSSSPFSPRFIGGLNMPRGKSSSSRNVGGGAASPPGPSSKRLSDPFQFRKKDKEDAAFGGFPLFSPRGSRSAKGKNSSPIKVSRSPVRKMKTEVAPTAPTPPSAEESETIRQPPQTLDTFLFVHAARVVFLLVACVGGVCELSVFQPVAIAGIFVHVSQHHSNDFAKAAVASCWVYMTSTVQASLGLCSIAAIVYCWSYADFRAHLCKRRRHIAQQLLVEESVNFAHVNIPNWLSQPDVDRVEWLNKVFQTGWPYLKIAIRNSLLGCINPLLESTRPAFMSAMSLAKIDLGNTAPVLCGVKFVSADTRTEEVTLDVEVRIVSDESLVAELRMVSNLGAAAVVSLRDLFLVGTLRVTLRPLCIDWPCFSALSLSFTQRPVFDFSLTAAKINISSVPFAYEWLHTFLHDLLMDYFVWPKVVDIPLWDEATSTPASNL